MYHVGISLLTMLWISSSCHSLNILAIFPHFGKSHQLVFEPLLKQLSLRGHNLTVISRFPLEQATPNRRDIDIGDGEKDTEYLEIGKMNGTRKSQFFCRFVLADVGRLSCQDGLAKKNLQLFLKKQNHFDLILMELFTSNCFIGISRLIEAPVIGLSSSNPIIWNSQLFTPFENPSYIPNHFSSFSDEMTFLQRVENTLLLCWDKLMYDYFISEPSNECSKEHLGIDILKGGNLMYNISLLLSNTHFTLNLPKPNVPNVIEVGGLHIQKSRKIPENIQKFINESSEGVIYMSMGSTLKGSSFPVTKRDEFLKAFSRTKQRVIWKWETEMENRPDNVKTLRWAPQREILCHPNVKAFISHGGLLGTIEAVHCGIPVIAIPQLGDQPLNARALEKVGGGIVLNLEDTTEKTILEALQKVLDPKFYRSAKDVSERFRDRPMSPMETAIYWIEYVAKYKGAPHMKTAAVSMPAYQYLLIDVIAFIAFFIIFFIYMFQKFVVLMFRKLKIRRKVKKL